MMPLLVTTTQALWCIDPARAIGHVIDTAHGSYYGVTFDEKAIYVAARRSGYAAGKSLPRAQRGAILEYDLALGLREIHEPPFALRDLHQIQVFDGALWAVCTYGDAVAVLRDGRWDVWHPLGEPPDGQGGPYHFNSITAHGEWLYVAGSVDRVGAIWGFERSSRAHRRTWLLGHGTHNVWVAADGKVHVLSSLSGEEHCVDGSSQVVSAGNFVRGVADCADTRWYGISSRAKRDDRESSDAMLLGIDRGSGDRRHLNLRGYGMVQEIRAPGQRDDAHAAVVGPPLLVSDLAQRFATHTLDGPPCLPPRPVLRCRVERGVQALDRALRLRRLRRRALVLD